MLGFIWQVSEASVAVPFPLESLLQAHYPLALPVFLGNGGLGVVFYGHKKCSIISRRSETWIVEACLLKGVVVLLQTFST